MPALVCPVCGDTELEWETVERLERLLASEQAPARELEVYDFEQEESADGDAVAAP